MAERRGGGQGQQPEPGEFRPEDFDSVDLPGAVPPEPEGGFDEPDLLAVDIAAPSPALIAAKEELAQRFVLSVTEEAQAAAAGTNSHGFENIVGVGISEKLSNGKFTGEQSVTVYVHAKASPDEIAPEAMVPDQINGFPTDVVVTGELHAQPFKGRYRPAPGGVSLGHFKITAGTLGCLVRKGRALYILSNNHVLANVNTGLIGDPILQPGPFDGGHVPADVIAKLSQFVPINLSGACNHVDCAIAQTSPTLVTPLDKCYGKLDPHPAPCRLNLLVKKCGRTTQFTRGRITDCHFTGRIGYGTHGAALFCNQIVITSLVASPFSAGGDSGSLIVTDQGNRPVGLLFAGSATHTIANPIGEVLAALGVTIVV